MIASREDLLSAVRRAPLSGSGLRVGPLSYVGGKDILFGKVTTEELRRSLVQKIKLAGSKYFVAETQWLMPGRESCLDEIPF